MNTGKRRRTAIEKVQRGHRYTLTEACSLVKECSFARFDETVDVAVRLGIDPKQADQQVRGACVLPHGTGSTKRVLVFARGEKIAEATDAGADYAGGDEYFAKINDEGWLEFDTVIATPDMMGLVGRLGKVLGPRGLMPNPKVGTVTFDVKKAVSEAKAGKVEFRVERKGAIVHVPVGKASFSEDKLLENVKMLVDTLVRLKPAAAKGTYLRSITLSSTMGPGVRIDPSSFQSGAEA
ncbi:MAG: 50S ribosomal protein L1 [Myxococcales bacterium]|nr:50S ribosomal protein L1 [Myxococcales bacterium]